MLGQVMKIIERLFKSAIRYQVDINSVHVCFMPCWSTTDAIFILLQLREKHFGKHKPLYFTFVNSEKAFDHDPGWVTSGMRGELAVWNG